MSPCFFFYIYSNLEFIRTNSNSSTRSRFSHKYSQEAVIVIVSKINEQRGRQPVGKKLKENEIHCKVGVI